MTRLRFTAGTGSHPRASAGNRSRIRVHAEGDEEWEPEDDEPLELMPGELTLPPPDPDEIAQARERHPSRFRVGFTNMDEPPPAPRSI